MPLRRRLTRSRRDRLTSAERRHLLLGIGKAPFTDEADRRAAWMKHRAELMNARREAKLPESWWTYEGPAKLRRDMVHELAKKYRRPAFPRPGGIEEWAGGHCALIWARNELERRRELWLAEHGDPRAA